MKISGRKLRVVSFYTPLLIMILLAGGAGAHVPLTPDGNGEISSALVISDPAKSWAIYGEIEGTGAEYYRFYAPEGQRISLSLFAPADADEGFQPGVVLMGPGLVGEGIPPSIVEVPDGYGFITLEGNGSGSPTYEPFGPSSFRPMAELDLEAPMPGMYYISVYDTERGGRYGLSLGYIEEFTFTERILSPIRLISVYIWSGQALGFIMAPMIAAAMAAAFVVWRRKSKSPFSSTGAFAGILFIGSSATTISQAIYNATLAPAGDEIMISIALAFFAALLGVLALRLSRGEAGILQRALMSVIGTVALLSGSGLIIGPLLAIISSVMPSRKGIRGSGRNLKG